MERGEPQIETPGRGRAERGGRASDLPGLALDPAARELLMSHATETYPEECCGILTGRVEPFGLFVGSVVPCENVSPGGDRRRRFEIEPKVVLDTIRSLGGGPEQLLGFYHSHPDRDATLSATDLEFIRLWPETVWLVVPVAGGIAGSARAWWLRGSEEPVMEMRWV
jgi:proteasome lid subunit RPN8/RPN11